MQIRENHVFPSFLPPSVLTSGDLSAHQKNPKRSRITGFFIPGDTGYLLSKIDCL